MRYYKAQKSGEKSSGVKRLLNVERSRASGASRRAVQVALAACICTLSLFVLGFTAVNAMSEGKGDSYITAVVQKGDTLWDIASRASGDKTDIRLLIHEIRKVNALTDSTLHPGAVLRIPTRAVR